MGGRYQKTEEENSRDHAAVAGDDTGSFEVFVGAPAHTILTPVPINMVKTYAIRAMVQKFV